MRPAPRFSPFSKPPGLKEAQAHVQAGRWPEAEAACRAALAWDEHQADVWDLLAFLQKRAGHQDEAIRSEQRAAALKPSRPEFANNLAVLLHQAGRYLEAIESAKRAVTLDPARGGYRYTLGRALQAMGDLPAAVACYRECMQRDPGLVDAYLNLGNLYVDMGEPAEGEHVLRRACLVAPNQPLGPLNLGRALQAQGKAGEALSAYAQACRMAQDMAMAWSNLGTAQQDLGRLDEAREAYGRAIQMEPGFPQAHVNLAGCLFMQGQVRQAFQEFEWYDRLPDAAVRQYEQPRWDGGPLEGRTLLLHADQGLGDTLQFARFASAVKGGRVILECPSALVRLLSSVPGLAQVVPSGAPLPEFDVHLPMMSLPAVLGLGDGDLGLAGGPWTVPQEDLTAWRLQVDAPGRLKVGIAWQGNPDFKLDAFRSVHLAAFEPLADLANLHLVSFQKGFGREQIHEVAWADRIQDLGEALGDLADAAAALRTLDVFVTVDSALAHVAGSIGVPTWLLLSQVADWRWGFGRCDTPWYDSVRLFRQTAVHDWTPVVQEIADRLKAGRL